MALQAVSNKPILSSGYRGGSGFWILNNSNGIPDFFFTYGNSNAVRVAYETCAPLSAIISRKSQAYINGKNWILSTSGKGKNKEAFSEVANKIRSLITRPNALQSWKQFEAQGYQYQQAYGYNVVLAIKPFGFPNTSSTALWNIPPEMLEIREKTSISLRTATGLNDFVESITMTWGGHRVPLDLDSISIFKDTFSSFSSFLLPDSRIRTLAQPINNTIGAYKSRGKIIYDRGALGIISSEKTDESGRVSFTPKEKEIIKEDFSRHGIMDGQVNYLLTNAALKWQSIGFSTKDLMLFEEIEDNVQRMCDSFNYPYRLLSSNKINSLGGSDLAEYKKLLYQDAIIPESEANYEQWNAFFETSQHGLVIDKDYSHIAVLQGDKLKEGQARKVRNEALQIEFYNNILTLNRWLELNGEDTLSEPEGNLRYTQLVALGWKFGASGNQKPKQDGTEETEDGESDNEN